jgi:hypothetical protein
VGAVVAAVILGPRRVRELGWRFYVPAAGCTGAALVALGAWSAYAGAAADDPRTAVDWSRGHVISFTLHRLPALTKGMIGNLGWLDTPLPLVVHLLFALLTLAVLVGVVASRDPRLIVASALVLLSLFLVPIVINVVSAPNAGPIWQGRYSLPMYASLGVIGMMAWRQVLDRTRRADVERLLRVGACSVFGVAEVVSFWQALRRYAVGTNGKIWLTGSLPWRPGIQPMVLILVNALVVGALCWAILSSTRARTRPGTNR